MKRLVVVLGGLLALPAFAEVAPFFYDDMAEYVDAENGMEGVAVGDEIIAEDAVASQPVVQPKPSARMGALSRSAAASSDASTGRASARSVSSRGAVAARAGSNVSSRGTTSRVVSSRGNVANTTGTVSARRAAGTNANVARAGTLTTSGGVTSNVADVGAATTSRVGVRSAGSAARAPSIASVSVTNTSTTNAETIKETTATMDSLAELTDYCKAQYTACMDNFCNVLDDNQGRCSCSKNVKNYEKTENALKAATEELQEVAQKIQYIGLSSDEISTLFDETEAEVAMRSASDSSQLKSSLDKVKNMIVDVKGGTASSVGDTSGISLDLSNLLSFNIDSTGFDLSALFGSASANTSSVSNQRGETLYKTAASRCKTAVLTNCIAQGVDAAVITNSYDLAIDKQCIAYERALSDSNTEMVATVRNAKTVLQKARLMIAQQKNQYDLRGCISALDSCMQDDYVCGADYEYCLDPSGKYVVDGEIVVGSLPGKSLASANSSSGLFNDGLYATWTTSGVSPWDGADSQNGNLASYISTTLTDSPVKQVDSGMSKFLQYKIGYNEDGKNSGMCISVLNKCQDYTYDKSSGRYQNRNKVIEEYLYRTLPKIRAAQDTLLASYAESCISDVASCLSSNNYGNSTAANNIAINSCKSIIKTCMSVNGNVTTTPTPDAMATWAGAVYDGTVTSTSGS